MARLCGGQTTPALAAEGGVPLDVVIVTGSAGTGKRTKAKASYSITILNEEVLRMQAPTSVTEAMKSVPGFWVESSGGEASGNTLSLGVPRKTNSPFSSPSASLRTCDEALELAK